MHLARAIHETAQALASQIPVVSDSIAGILSSQLRQVPPDDQLDVLQDAAVRILEFRPNQPGLTHAVVRGCLLDYFKRRRHRQKHLCGSLEAPISSSEDAPRLMDVISGGTFDTEDLGDRSLPFSAHFGMDVAPQLSTLLDILVIMSSMPRAVRATVDKRLAGWSLSANERQQLRRWRKEAVIIE
jgi:hypothetical protein